MIVSRPALLSVMAAAAIVCPYAGAEVVITSMNRIANVFSQATDGFDSPFDTERDEEPGLTGSFNATISSAVSGEVAITGGTATNSTSASLSTEIVVTQADGETRIDGTVSSSAAASQIPANGGTAISDASSILLLEIEVTGGTESISFAAESAPAIIRSGVTGFGSVRLVFNVFTSFGSEVLRTGLLCMRDPSFTSNPPCPDEFDPVTLELEAGTYFIEVNATCEASSGAGIEATQTSSWTLAFAGGDPCEAKGAEEGECSCEREWAAGSGDFDVPENWTPEFVPEDDGNGCNDIFLTSPGGYEITYGSIAAADSLSVSTGSPTLSGGTLTLGGFDSTALRVDGDAALKIGSGTVQADTVLGSGTGPTLALQPGASLSVVTALETGRDAGAMGTLSLETQGTATSLSVAGNATLGGGGNSVVSGAGAISFNVLGGLSMAVFPGSESQLTLGEVTETPGGTVEFGVGDAFNVGGGGTASATLEGAVTATAGSLQLGLLENGAGTLNLSGGATLEVAGDARIGVEGSGKLAVDTEASLSADTLLISGPKPADGKADAESSLLSVTNGGGISVTTLLETGRDADDMGVMELGGGEGTTTVSVAGNAVFGGGGGSLVTGLPALTVDVLGDLFMAVFPGSESQLLLGQS